jgi:peptidoglycan/xylan/chitin deacetylase (PgdA/CDA1 family)
VTHRLDRREFVALLAAGLAATLAGCGGKDKHSATPTPSTTASATGTPTGTPAPISSTPIPYSPQPTQAQAKFQAKPMYIDHGTRNVALTIDDGYDAETLEAYVKFCEDTGTHLTFSAVGSCKNWGPLASRIQPLVEAGQVEIINHTYSHLILTQLPDAQVRKEIERNDEWIAATFKTTGKPFFRPPGGLYDARVQQIAADSGYTETLMWATSLGDSSLLTPAQLLTNAKKAFWPGAVVLGHANHPTVTHLYPDILALIKEHRLTPVTISAMQGA